MTGLALCEKSRRGWKNQPVFAWAARIGVGKHSLVGEFAFRRACLGKGSRRQTADRIREIAVDDCLRTG